MFLMGRDQLIVTVEFYFPYLTATANKVASINSPIAYLQEIAILKHIIIILLGQTQQFARLAHLGHRTTRVNNFFY